MALTPIPVGDDIATFVKSLAPPPGTAVTDALLKTMWEGIVTRIYAGIVSGAVVTSVGADPQGGSVNSTGTIA